MTIQTPPTKWSPNYFTLMTEKQRFNCFIQSDLANRKNSIIEFAKNTGFTDTNIEMFLEQYFIQRKNVYYQSSQQLGIHTGKESYWAEWDACVKLLNAICWALESK